MMLKEKIEEHIQSNLSYLTVRIQKTLNARKEMLEVAAEIQEVLDAEEISLKYSCITAETITLEMPDVDQARNLATNLLIAIDKIERFDRRMDSSANWRLIGRLGDITISIEPAEPDPNCEIETHTYTSKYYSCANKNNK